MSTNKRDKNHIFANKRRKLLGLDGGQLIKSYFGNSALVSILILSLITIFLFKEGIGFFGQNYQSLKLYRASALEYVDIIRSQNEGFLALNRYLNSIRTQQSKILDEEGYTFSEIQKEIKKDQAFYQNFSRLNKEMSQFIASIAEQAVGIREQAVININLKEKSDFIDDKIKRLRKKKKLNDSDRFELSQKLVQLSNTYRSHPEKAESLRLRSEAIQKNIWIQEDLNQFIDFLQTDKSKIAITPVDFETEVAKVIARSGEFYHLSSTMEENLQKVLKNPLVFSKYPELQKSSDRFLELIYLFLSSFAQTKESLDQWSPNKPIAPHTAFTAFITGKDWTTASDWQDVYGLLPLLTGSLLVSGIALLFAIPFGVGAAIYVNQLASLKEQNLIKPYIEFISAIPSVVIGFFGIAVFGKFLRDFSGIDFLSWVPFFPISERLNAFTAGGLLALMAIPTIFTLCEDALNNVPKSFKEASFALGGNRLQTIFKVIFPCALSGIVSAILLGFGRVIGETMVVLLCAGNRIKIPDFTNGVGTIFDPVHTMTGIVAQEMGEVVNGSIHYRALFIVGICLFFISLLVNYLSQWIVRKYKVSNG